MRLNLKAFSLACGTVAGVGMFLLTWWSILLVGATGEPTFLGKYIYPGYNISPLGSLIGLVYGFVDWLITSLALGWLYNRLAARKAA